jgi:hypothetical protein
VLTPHVQEVTDLGRAVVVRGRATGAFLPKQGGAEQRIDSWFLQVYRESGTGDCGFGAAPTLRTRPLRASSAQGGCDMTE